MDDARAVSCREQVQRDAGIMYFTSWYFFKDLPISCEIVSYPDPGFWVNTDPDPDPGF